jgi:hypothetical protein
MAKGRKKATSAKKYGGMRHQAVVRKAAKKMTPRTNKPC